MDPFRMVEELLELEERQLDSELDEAERERWIELSMLVSGIERRIAQKRWSTRIHLVRSASVLRPERDDAARVLSLSAGGLFLSTACRPREGEDIEVTVALPLRAEVETTFRAQVRWVSPEGSSVGVGGLGASFVGVSPQQRAALLTTLREHLFRQASRSFGGSLASCQLFFESLPDIVVAVDPEGTVAAASARAGALLGSADRALDGAPFHSFVAAGYRMATDKSFEMVWRGAPLVRREIALRLVGAGPTVLDTAFSPVVKDGEVVAVMVAAREPADAETVAPSDPAGLDAADDDLVELDE